MARTDPHISALLDAFQAARTPENPFPPERIPLAAALMEGDLPQKAVRSILRRFQDMIRQRIIRVEESDLLQEARLALVGFIDDFDTSFGKDFTKCARYRMYQKLYGVIRDSTLGGRAALASVEKRIREVSLDDTISHRNRSEGGSEMLRHEVIEGNEDTPHEAFQKNEITKAVRMLPDPQRTAITMVIVEQRSLREAAEIMGCAHSTVSDYVDGAKELLRELLSQYADGIDKES